MKEKLHIGTTNFDGYEFLTLQTQGTEMRLRAETVERYLALTKQGAFALTTADMSVESWFLRASGALKFLERARPSKRSFLSTNLLLELSVELLGYDDSDEERELMKDVALAKTIRDYASNGKVSGLGVKGHELRFEFNNRDFMVEEMARGDFDGDGLEDSLVFVAWNYKEGSGRGYSLHWISGANTSTAHQLLDFPLP